jgi:hypothetical protein
MTGMEARVSPIKASTDEKGWRRILERGREEEEIKKIFKRTFCKYYWGGTYLA